MGRPSSYTPKIVAEICERLSEGEPLEQICRDENMPSSGTVHAWKAGKVDGVPDSVSSDIACAREIGYDVIAERLRHTARGDATIGESKGDIQRDKLIIDTDLKLLSKWTKRYADKVDHVSSDGSMSPKTIDTSKLSESTLEEIVKAADESNE